MNRPILSLKKKPPQFPNGKKPRDVVDFFRAKWPQCFTEPPRPIKIGIQHDIAAALESECLDKKQRAAIGHALRYLTRSLAYLKVLAAGEEPRIDLDGVPGELPTEEHRENARVMRAAIKDNLRTQRKAAAALAADIERARASKLARQAAIA